MMKNFYFMTQHSFAGDFVMPYLWCSLKTYYEKNGQQKENWNWKDPFLYEKTDNEIFELLEKDPPNVFGFSVYVWNEDRLDRIAKHVKEKYPTCLIVYGGPQQNVKHDSSYFMKKDWVDISLFTDAYGEVVLTKILDLYPAENYWQVPSIYFTDITRKRLKSLASVDKRAFKWPSKIFQSQEHIILDRINQAKSLGEDLQVFYETSRGCPYSCIYCEWGGGVGGKVVKRPYEDTVEDINWLINTAGINGLDIVDANFGMFKEDIDLAKHIAMLKRKTGLPNNVDIDSAKNHPDNLLKIKDILWEHDLATVYTVSLQTLNEEARRNIKRIDIPLEKHMECIQYLKSKYTNVPVYIERIIGLPGETVESIYKQLDIIYNIGLEIGTSKPVPWVLLPEAEAFDPIVRNKFKLNTVNKLFDFNPKLKDNRDLSYPADKISVVSNSWVNPEIETVVESYSYSSDQWLEMRHIFDWTLAGQPIGLNNYFLKYLHTEYDVLPSDIYKILLEKSKIGFGIDAIDDTIAIERKHSREWLVNNNVRDALIDLGPSWPLLLPTQNVLSLALLKNIRKFYNFVAELFSKKYDDTKIIDLSNWIVNSVIDPSYNPDNGRTFTSEYNWLAYFSTGSLEKGNYKFSIDDHKNSYVWWHKFADGTTDRDIAYVCQVMLKSSSDTYSTKIASTLRLVT